MGRDLYLVRDKVTFYLRILKETFMYLSIRDEIVFAAGYDTLARGTARPERAGRGTVGEAGRYRCRHCARNATPKAGSA